jgi:hypothetical protein
MAADGFLPGGKAAGSITVNTHLHPELRRRIYGTIPPLPMHLQIIMFK